jgi:aspartate aminotransferase
MINLAQRISKIKPSPTLEITRKANALKAAGRDIVNFGAGEPDFDTPPHIKLAAVKAIEEGFTKYTAVGGIDELKDAIIRKFQQDNHLTYTRPEVVVSCGAKHVLYNLIQVLCEEGDEVIIPSPYWVSYLDIVVLSGAIPVVLKTEASHGFKIQPKQLEGLITNKTKAIIINSPSNPAGIVYSKEEIKAFADILRGKDIIVISDDIYEKIIYDDLAFYNIASVDDSFKQSTVVINGVSKTYAMTGWRIGYAAGPQVIIDAITKLQSQNTSNPTSISQKAALEALNGRQDDISRMVAEFRRRRDVIVARLNAIPGISCMSPSGSFYVFPDVSGLLGRSHQGKTLSNSSELAAYLLDEAGVAVVPGADFGHDEYMRLSYATSMKNIEVGVEKIKKAVMNLS